jgi:hypothetical protein
MIRELYLPSPLAPACVVGELYFTVYLLRDSNNVPSSLMFDDLNNL